MNQLDGQGHGQGQAQRFIHEQGNGHNAKK
jgi:hypothetical protein